MYPSGHAYLVVWEEVVQFEGCSNSPSDLRRFLACGQRVLFREPARDLL